ncbi:MULTISPECIES: choice-of-anchor D domain-containing protein [unclassified Variovorax]|nr:MULTISPECIES: choice-of-anchor D domain-containing protein [unclassified Variovorax]VTU43223.1 IPT/TIG domain protein [Variovorax sp. PBL-H6]VTU43420.1 IPT/TIG domain protein [Variovorax sp. PBL-E5]
MRPSFKRFVCALLSATIVLQPALSAAASDFRYRIPIDIKLTGQADLEIQPELTDFGDVARTQMRTLPVKVVNHGGGAATDVTAVATAPFAVEKTCSTVPAHGECTMLVSFMPQEAGPQFGSLVLQGSNSRAEGSLIGNAVRLLTDLEISENGWNFGTWKLGTTSTVKQLAVKNVGNVPAIISQMYFLDGGSDFKVSHNCSTSLSPGAACIVAVNFIPTAMGQRVGALRVKSGDGSIRDVGMLGFGGDHTDPSEGAVDGRLSAPDSVSLGDVVVGEAPATKTITLANAGTKELTLGSPTLGGPDAALFSSSSTCGATLPAYATCQLALAFSPAVVGTFSAQLAIPTGAGQTTLTKTVALSGKGVSSAAKGQLSTNMSEVDFGTTTLGTAVSRVVRVTNAGPDVAEVTHTYATNSANFVVTTGCTAPLAAGEYCDLTVQYTASSVERSIGDLVIASQAGQNLLVHLKGHVPAPVLEVAPGSLQFEAMSQGDTSNYQEVTVTNVGSAPLEVTNVGLASTVEFNQENSCGSPLAPGASCAVRVQFTPNGSGTRETELLVVSNDPVNPAASVSLRGVGLSSELQFTPSRLAFGSVSMGSSSAPEDITISSVGAGNALISGVNIQGSGFSQVNTCGVKLPKGESCTVTVTYTPTAAASETGYLRVYSPQGVQMASLSGEGLTADQALVVDKRYLNFGSFEVGQGSSADIQVSNSGSEALSLNAPSLSGADAAAFTTSTTCGATLASSESCVVSVAFSAQALKPHAAALTVATAGGVQREVLLYGKGVDHVPAAVLTASPNPLSFGAATPASPATAALRISNAGPEAVSLVSVDSTDPTNFTSSETDCREPIAAGTHCDLPVRFLAGKDGLVTAQLNLRAENQQPLAVALTGQGPTPRISVAPTALDFGSVDFLATAPQQTVTVQNTGNARLALSGVGISGAFTQSNTCGPELAPSATCEIQVGFNPVSGGAQAGTLVISSNDPTMPTYSVALAGLSLLGSVAATPTELAFGQVAMGEHAAQVVSIYNPGPGGVGISSIALDGLNKTAFSFTSDCGPQLGKDKACSVTVRFSPQASGAHEAALAVVPQTGNRLTIPLTGNGPTARASVDSNSLAFGSVVVGESSAAQTVMLTNESTGPLNVYDISMATGAESFGVSSDCVSPLATGQSCPLYVSFTPASGGALTGALRLKTANSGGPLDVALTGTGLLPQAALSQPSVDFGTVYVGGTAESVVQVKNTGAYPVKVNSIGIPDNTWFQQNNACSQPLRAGEACDIALNVFPTTAGPQSSTLTVLTTAGTLTATLGATGQGVKLTRVTPSIADSNGGTLVSVLGAGFTAATRIFFGDVAASTIQVRGSTQLDVVAPAHATGVVDVTMTNDAGLTATLPQALRYAGAPVIASTTPATGSVAGGWPTLLQGRDFAEGMKVLVDGQAAQVTSVSADGSSATVVVPARLSPEAGTVDVVATTAVGNGTLSKGLAYVLPQGKLKLLGQGAFGNIAVGATYGRIFTLTNTGDLPTQLVGLSPEPSGTFSIGTNGTCPTALPAPLAVGASCTVEVLASNAAQGTVAGTLTASTGGPTGTQVSVSLSASFVQADYALSGTAGSMALVSGNYPTIIAMSEEGGANGTQQKIIYLNNVLKAAGTRIDAATVTITGADAGQFAITEVRKSSNSGSYSSSGASISGDRLTATGATVDAGSGTYPHLGVVVTFAPKAKGTFNAQLNIDYNGGSRAQLPLFGVAEYFSYAALSGTASANPVVAPNGDFGTLTFNDGAGLTSDALKRKFFLVSTSNAGKRLQATHLSIIGADAASFAITGYSYRATADGTLPAQDVRPANMRQGSVAEALLVEIAFSPMRAGAQEAQLVVEHNGDNAQPAVVNLTGTGAYDVSVQASGGPFIADIPPFPVTGVGASSTLDTYVRNTGTFGQVTWKSIQIVGSQAFSVKGVSLTNTGSTSSSALQAQPASTRYVNMNLVGADARTMGLSDLRALLAFSPTTTGVQTATVTVFHDGPGGKTTYTLTGEGRRAAAALSSTAAAPYVPASGDLGVAGFNAPGDASNGSVSKTLNVVNWNTLGLLRVTRLRITGADASAFAIESYPNQPGGYVPSPDVSPAAMVQGTASASLPFKVKFFPVKLGAHEAKLEVYHDGMNISPVVLPLSGTASRDVMLAVSEGTSATIVEPTPFADTLVGNTSNERSFYLRATGSAGAVTYTGASIEGTTDIALTGSGLVRQGGTAAVASAFYSRVASAEFNYVGANVAPTGGYTDLVLKFTFQPSSLSQQVAKVTVTHNGPGGKTTFLLTGNGVQPIAALSAASALAANPAPPISDFGVVSYNASNPSPTPTTLTNYVVNTAGVGSLRVNRMVITGPDASSFQFTSWTGQGTAPAANDVTPIGMVQTTSTGPHFKVTFLPAHMGVHTAQVAIYHNGGNTNPLVLPISGTAASDVNVTVSDLATSVQAPAPYPVTVAGTTASKLIYLRVTGTKGQVTYTGFKVEGSPSFGVTSSLNKYPKGTTSYGGIVKNYNPDVVREDAFSWAGEDISKSGAVTDLGITVRYAPTEVGTETAKVTVFHTGPGGKTEFLLSGSSIKPIVQFSGTNVSKPTAASGDMGVATYNGPTGAAAGTVLKDLYLVNTNKVGYASVPRMRIVGADASAFTFATWTNYSSAENTGQDVSPTSLKQNNVSTNLNVRLQFKPTKAGAHAAQLLIDHNGANTSPLTLDLSGAGERDVTGVFATVDFADNGLIPDFAPQASIANSAFGSSTKLVNLRVAGSRGRVTYSGFKVEGSPAFAVTTVYAVHHTGASKTQLFTYAAPGVTEGAAPYVGADVAGGAVLSDYGLNVTFAPTTLGAHTATLTVFHDGPGGQTSFRVNGAAQTEMQLSSRPDIADYEFGASLSSMAQVSAPLPVYIRRTTGTTPLQVGTVELSGPDADQFSILSVVNVTDNAGTQGTSLWSDSQGAQSAAVNASLAGATGAVNVVYRPSRTPGASGHTATLTVSRAGFASQSVQLTGSVASDGQGFARFRPKASWNLSQDNLIATAVSPNYVGIGPAGGIRAGKWYFEVTDASPPPVVNPTTNGDGSRNYYTYATNLMQVGVGIGSSTPGATNTLALAPGVFYDYQSGTSRYWTQFSAGYNTPAGYSVATDARLKLETYKAYGIAIDYDNRRLDIYVQTSSGCAKALSYSPKPEALADTSAWYPVINSNATKSMVLTKGEGGTFRCKPAGYEALRN